MKKIIRIKVPSIEDAIVRCLLHNVNMTNLSKRLLIVLLQKIKSGDVLTTEIKNDLCQIMGWNTKNNIVNLMKVLKDLNETSVNIQGVIEPIITRSKLRQHRGKVYFHSKLYTILESKPNEIKIETTFLYDREDLPQVE